MNEPADKISDELLAELIAIYDEDRELVAALRELQNLRIERLSSAPKPRDMSVGLTLGEHAAMGGKVAPALHHLVPEKYRERPSAQRGGYRSRSRCRPRPASAGERRARPQGQDSMIEGAIAGLLVIVGTIVCIAIGQW